MASQPSIEEQGRSISIFFGVLPLCCKPYLFYCGDKVSIYSIEHVGILILHHFRIELHHLLYVQIQSSHITRCHHETTILFPLGTFLSNSLHTCRCQEVIAFVYSCSTWKVWTDRRWKQKVLDSIDHTIWRGKCDHWSKCEDAPGLWIQRK